jgi:hypothetical protein
MKANCSKHGEVELTAPNANGDCFCSSCAFEMLTQGEPGRPELARAMSGHFKQVSMGCKVAEMTADEHVEALADAIEQSLPPEAVEALRDGLAVVTAHDVDYGENAAVKVEHSPLDVPKVLDNARFDQLAKQLGMEMSMRLHQLMRERKAAGKKEREATPVCHLVFHPFLGKPFWKDTCPQCGWVAPKQEEAENMDVDFTNLTGKALAESIEEHKPLVGEFARIRTIDLAEMVELLGTAFSCFELIESVLPKTDDEDVDEARGVALQQIRALRDWRGCKEE